MPDAHDPLPSPERPKGAAGICPVDQNTRSAWLAAASGSSDHSTHPHPVHSQSHPIPTTIPSDTTKSPPTQTCDSSNIEFRAHFLPSNAISHGLSTAREISSIPRGNAGEEAGGGGGNLENVEAHTSSSKNWIYPSQAMFFAAMKRKNWDPRAEDMRTIVPIHNAVNERAWKEIREWEIGRGAEICGGPKLVSFSGDSSKLTPKARFRCLLGYTPPFDRHDWIVDRCGKQIEYVIDFYSGKKDPRRPEAVSFYLDVRPKINSVEGVRMRLGRLFSKLWP